MFTQMRTLDQVESDIQAMEAALKLIESKLEPLHFEESKVRCELQHLWNQRERLRQLEGIL